MKTIFDTVNEQLAKVKQETASTMNSVPVKLTEQFGEQKAMVEAVGKMVAELKLMQGKLDTVQNWQTENEQKYAEMHADYMEYKIKNEGTEGQQEDQLEAQTSAPTFTFGQTIPQTKQTVPTIVKAEPSAGQAQGAFIGQPESSSLLLHPTVFWATTHPPNSLGLDQISHFPILPFSRLGIIIPTVLLLLFLLLWVQAVHQLPHRIFSRPLPGSQKILLASIVRVQRTRMHGWLWCIITLFSWLEPRNKKLHTQPHSYVMLHRSGGLVICGGIMGSLPMIGILWRKPFWSDLARTFVRRRHRPNCNTSHRAADLCVSIQLSSSCIWDVRRVLMNVVSFDSSFGDWRNLWRKP